MRGGPGELSGSISQLQEFTFQTCNKKTSFAAKDSGFFLWSPEKMRHLPLHTPWSCFVDYFFLGIPTTSNKGEKVREGTKWCPTESRQQKEGITCCKEQGEVGQPDPALAERHETAGTGDVVPMTGSPLLSQLRQVLLFACTGQDGMNTAWG